MSDNFTLREFNYIASGEYNAGQIDIAPDEQGKMRLTKVNNHIKKIELNNVAISKEHILRVKQAFIDALEKGGVDPLMISEIREKIGIPSVIDIDAVGREKSAELAQRRLEPLTRQQVRDIIDEYAYRGRDCINGSNEHNAEEQELAFKPRFMSKKNAAKRDLTNTQNKSIKTKAYKTNFAHTLDLLTLKSSLTKIGNTRSSLIRGLNAENNRVADHTSLCNSYKNYFSQALSLLKEGKNESESFRLCNQTVKLVKENNGNVSALVGEGATATKIQLGYDVPRLINLLMGQVAVDQEFLGSANVKNLLNQVYDKDLEGTLTAADHSSLTRQFATIILAMRAGDLNFDHVCRGNYNTGLLVEVAEHALDGNITTAEQVERYHAELVKNNSGLTDEMKAMLADVATIPLKANKEDQLFDVKPPIVGEINEIAQEIHVEAPLENRTVPVKEIKNFVADLVFSDDTMVADVVINRPGETMRKILTEDKNIHAFAEIVKNPDVLQEVSSTEVVPVLKEGFNKIRDILLPLFAASEGKTIEETLNDPQYLQKFSAFLKNQEALPGLELSKFDNIIQNMANRGCENIQTFINKVFKTGVQDLNAQGGITTEPYKNKTAEQIKEELDAKSLNKILDDASTDATVPGQIGLFKQVLSEYFINMSKADKRSSFAAALRYADTFEFKDKKGVQLTGDALNSAKNAALNKYTGAILKGTSPLLQKMMQGLPKSVMGEFADALDDMKSSLAPIPRKIVQAHMMKMIKSNNNIVDISVDQSLGAASVGEAFLCHFSIKGEDGKIRKEPYVVKLMRHDAEQRVNREAEIFTAAAAKIGPGMLKTWEGQLQQYMKEFDFTTEAQNTNEGYEIYHVFNNRQHPSYAIAPNVDCMKVAAEVVPPSKNALVITKASGQTVDKFFKECTTSIQNAVASLYQRDPVTNKVLWDKETKKPLLKEKFSTAAPGLIHREVSSEFVTLKNAHTKILQAARQWFTEAVLGSGKFHGDCHAGNIMISGGQATFIDFGNLYKLETKPAVDAEGKAVTDKNGQPVMLDERSELLRLIIGATLRRKDFFMKGFENLLSPAGKSALAANRDKAEAIVESLLSKGAFSFDVCYRLQGAISELQKLGLELPPQINCFVQSMTRLQNTVAEMNTIMNQSKQLMETADNIELDPDKGPTDECDILGKMQYFSLTKEGKKLVETADEEIPNYAVKITELEKAGNFQPGGDYFNTVKDRIANAADPVKTVEELISTTLEKLDPAHSTIDKNTQIKFEEIISEFKTVMLLGPSPEEKEEAIMKFVTEFCTSVATSVNMLGNSYLLDEQANNAKAEDPDSFASVIMKTFFDNVDVAAELINNTFAEDGISLANSAREIAKDELGLGFFGSMLPSNVLNAIVNDTHNMGGDNSYQLDIGI